MSLRIKDAVRERDGHKCRDCGITDAEYRATAGRALEVHRLVPGCTYDERWCVTLCGGCHSRKPRNVKDVLFGNQRTGVAFAIFNLYDEREARIVEALVAVAKDRGCHWSDVLAEVLYDWLQRQGADYCI